MRIAEFCYCLGLTRYSGTRANFMRATSGAPTPSSATPPATGQVRVSGKKADSLVRTAKRCYCPGSTRYSGTRPNSTDLLSREWRTGGENSAVSLGPDPIAHWSISGKKPELRRGSRSESRVAKLSIGGVPFDSM